MDRKTFILKGSLFCLGASLAKPLAGKILNAEDNDVNAEDVEKLVQEWFDGFYAGFNQNIPDSTRQKILQMNGQACARRGATKAAQNANGDLEVFLTTLKQWVGEQNISRDKNQITIRYEHCYCPIAQNPKIRSLTDFCQCSVGWIEEMFTTATGKPVAVELIASIRNGAKHCEFLVTV